MRKAFITALIAAVTVPVIAATPAEARRHDNRRYHRTENGVQYWRGNDGRYRCRKSNGTTGLLIGGVGGALLGRAVDGGRDKTLGTVLGAGAGALAGRSIDRNNSRPRCD